MNSGKKPNLGPYTKEAYQEALQYHERLERLYAKMGEEYPVHIDLPVGDGPNPQDVSYIMGENDVYAFIRVPSRHYKKHNTWAFRTQEALDWFKRITPEQYEAARHHRRTVAVLAYFAKRGISQP